MRRRRLVPLLCATALVGGLAAAGSASNTPVSAAPTFQSYAAPIGLGDSAGEPTLGINPTSGAVLFQAYTQFLKVTDFDVQGPGRATWVRQPFPLPQISLDPILETDPDTGRTFTSQLLAACSEAGYTDDDGATFSLSQGCGPGAMVDHQSIGTGHYVAGSPLVKNPVANYPNVVYYCAQDIASGNCSVSTDGGRTFDLTTVAFSTPDCGLGGLFGHLKTAPDGTVYLPPSRCNRGAAVAVSENNGVTWSVRQVPQSLMGDAGHPVVATGTNGDVYLAWGSPLDDATAGQSGPVRVAWSTDKGRSWTAPVPLGQDLPEPIRNSRFPIGVAGDDGRAVIGYLGSTTGGNGSAPGFTGRWDLYLSYTQDHGTTWHTYQATDHPVQIGSICTAGTTCGSDRNLLDFNDMVLDPRTGRVVVALADGCPGTGQCSPAVRKAKATIVRQTSGPSLLAAFDQVTTPQGITELANRPLHRPAR